MLAASHKFDRLCFHSWLEFLIESQTSGNKHSYSFARTLLGGLEFITSFHILSYPLYQTDRNKDQSRALFLFYLTSVSSYSSLFVPSLLPDLFSWQALWVAYFLLSSILILGDLIHSCHLKYYLYGNGATIFIFSPDLSPSLYLTVNSWCSFINLLQPQLLSQLMTTPSFYWLD